MSKKRSSFKVKKDRWYYSNLLSDLRKFVDVKKRLPRKDLKNPTEGIYMWRIHSNTSKKLFDWFINQNCEEFIPYYSKKEEHGLKKNEILSHVYEVSVNLIITLCVDHVEHLKKKSNQLDRLCFKILRICQKEFPSIFPDFIPLLEKLKSSCVDLTNINENEVPRNLLNFYRNVSSIIRKTKQWERKEISGKKKKFYLLHPQDARKLSTDVLFHHIFSNLGIVDLIDFPIVSKRFNVNLWEFCLKNRMSKCPRDYFLLLQSGRVPGDVLMSRLIYYRTVDPDEFARFSIPCIFSFPHFSYSIQFLAEKMTNIDDFSFRTAEKRPSQAIHIFKMKDFLTNTNEFCNVSKFSFLDETNDKGHHFLNMIKFWYYYHKKNPELLFKNTFKNTQRYFRPSSMLFSSTDYITMLKYFDVVCDDDEPNMFLEGLNLLVEMYTDAQKREQEIHQFSEIMKEEKNNNETSLLQRAKFRSGVSLPSLTVKPVRNYKANNNICESNSNKDYSQVSDVYYDSDQNEDLFVTTASKFISIRDKIPRTRDSKLKGINGHQDDWYERIKWMYD